MPDTKRARLARFKPALSSASTNTDAFIRHLSRLLTTSNGIDNTLSTVLFTATLLHSQLTRLLARRYEKLALALASKAAQSVGPGETIVASIDIEPPPSTLSQTCGGLKALANTSAEMWMFMRLFSLIHIYRWASETYSTTHRDAIVKTLLWAQIASAATFQAIENIAYLASKGILPGPRLEKRWPWLMALSNRFWMAQIVLEGLRLLRVRQLKWDEELGAEKKDEDGQEMHVESDALKERWKRDFYANAGWFPLTLHWSYEDEAESPVAEVWQGICGLVPSVFGLLDAWRETA